VGRTALSRQKEFQMKTQTIMKKLRQYMSEHHQGDADIAREIGVEPQTITYWLAGLHEPRPANVAMLLGLLHPKTNGASTPNARSTSSNQFEAELLVQLATIQHELSSMKSALKTAEDLYLEQALALEARERPTGLQVGGNATSSCCQNGSHAAVPPTESAACS